MDKKLKTKWIRALRSGKFKQWREGALVEPTADGEGASYCCLGVLRHVMNPKDKRSRKGMNCYLSDPQLRVAGLTHEAQEELAEKNDSGRRFPAIANYIEKKL